MFFVFKVEVLEVPGGSRACFWQNFYTSESSLMLLVSWMPWCVGFFQDLFQDVLVCVPGCLGMPYEGFYL